MKTSSAVRNEIEAALSRRLPGALSPQIRAERVRFRTGIRGVDVVACGGVPAGAITEVVGTESSGRTTLAATFVARRAAEGQVFAWVDVTDALDPESMAASGVDLERMLWVRCGAKREAGQGQDGDARSSGSKASGAAMLDRTISAPSLSGGCGSPHPRSEGRGMSEAIGGLMGGLAAELMLGVAESRGSTRSQPGGNRALLPTKRKDKWIGTPSAPNRVADKSEFSWRSEHREEQVPTDRLPARRGKLIMSPKSGTWEPRCAEPQGRRAVESRDRAGAGAEVKIGSAPVNAMTASRSSRDTGAGGAVERDRPGAAGGRHAAAGGRLWRGGAGSRGRAGGGGVADTNGDLVPVPGGGGAIAGMPGAADPVPVRAEQCGAGARDGAGRDAVGGSGDDRRGLWGARGAAEVCSTGGGQGCCDSRKREGSWRWDR